MIRCTDRLLIMFHNQNGVAEVAQPSQRYQQSSLSRWCRPIDGSSSTYSTPVRPEPIWLASRMRWLSPPDNVAEPRDKVR